MSEFSLSAMRDYFMELHNLQRVRAWRVSTEFDMSDAQFHKRLKMEGTTFIKELNRERERRLNQMVEDKVDITNELCAEEFGFSSESAFQTWHKNYFGITPSEWKDKYVK